MSDLQSTTNPEPTLDDLRLRSEALERQLATLQSETDARLLRAELKAEAVRAGMVDLDGLKLVDLKGMKLNENGEVENAASLMAQLRRAKPWLFGGTSSSSSASPPAAQAPKQKTVKEMSDAEYRVARAELLRRR